MNINLTRSVKASLRVLIMSLAVLTQGGLESFAQAPTSAPSPPLGKDVPATSVTLAQIIARQRETISQIRSASGVAVWREDVYTTSASSVPPLRLVHFAYSTTGSVNLIIPWDGKTPIGRLREKPDWSKVLAAYLVRDDVVYGIKPAQLSRDGWITATPYNPAVHDRNPLVAFRIEYLADERVTLADLYASQKEMETPPQIIPAQKGGNPRLWVIFSNPRTPGESLRYLVNPSKGYLTEYIGRFSGGRKIFETTIVLGKAGNTVWIPARRIKYEYQPNGTLQRRSEWYFHTLEVNSMLPPYELSFSYFHLPPEAWPQKIQTNAPK